jgi:hypothetical protein
VRKISWVSGAENELDYGNETAALSRADLAQVIIERWSYRRSVGTTFRCRRRRTALLNTSQTIDLAEACAVTGGKSLAVLAQTLQTQLSRLSARGSECYFLPRTLVLRRTSAGTEEHVTLKSVIYKHRIFQFKFCCTDPPQLFLHVSHHKSVYKNGARQIEERGHHRSCQGPGQCTMVRGV